MLPGLGKKSFLASSAYILASIACPRGITLLLSIFRLFPSAIFPNRAPTNKTLLTIFIGGENNPERALLPIEEILPHVKKDLEKLLGLKGDPIHTSLNIWTHAIPQYDSKITQVHQYLSILESNQPGLYFAGNYRDGISITNSIKSGYLVVKKLLNKKRKVE